MVHNAMEYYSAMKRNAFESVLMRWMNLEPIIQSEVNQKEKDKYCSVQFSHSVVSNSLWLHGLRVACQASLSITNSWSLLKLMSIESVRPSNQLILCHPLLLLERWYRRIYLKGSNGDPNIENRLKDMGRGEERVKCMETVTGKLTLPYVK